MLYRLTGVGAAMCCLFSDLSPAWAVPGCPAERIWTTTQDFKDPGGVPFRLQEPDETPGRLELIAPPPVYQGPPYTAGPGLFPFANVACLQRGTVVRINVNAASADAAIVGQFYSAPAGRSRSPSRLAVDHYGNVWCVHRQEWANGMGAVVRIALLIGGTRVDGSGQPSATGQFLVPPFDYCSVGDWKLLDRDDDDRIRTSHGLGLTLGWDQALTGGNDAGGVSLAEDELIFSYTRIPGTSTELGGAVAIDAHSDVWTGGYANTTFQKLSGAFTSAVPGIADYLVAVVRAILGQAIPSKKLEKTGERLTS